MRYKKIIILFLIVISLFTTTKINNENIKLQAQVNNKWISKSGSWYYYDNGKKYTGWHYLSNKWFWFSKDGKLHTGYKWEKSHNHWMYLNGSNGYKTRSTLNYNGERYNFDGNAYTTMEIGGSNVHQIWDSLLALKIKNSTRDEIMKVIYGESEYRPHAYNSAGYYGIAQWGGERKKSMQKYCHNHINAYCEGKFMVKEFLNHVGGFNVYYMNTKSGSSARSYMKSTYEH